MHPSEREAVTEAQSFLQSHLVITEALLRYLRQHQVLEERDCTRIKAEVSNERKLRTFSNIVQCKPEDSFSNLLVVLEETKNTEVADHLRQREKEAQKNCEKLQEQLPHWLRGRYCECPGRWTALHEVVQQVQSELFSGLSEPCISSLLTQVLPAVYTTARIEDTGIQSGQRVVQNVISNMALHLIHKRSAQSTSSDEAGVQTRINPPSTSGASVESSQSNLQGNTGQEQTLQQKQPTRSHLLDNEECPPSAPSMMENNPTSSSELATYDIPSSSTAMTTDNVLSSAALAMENISSSSTAIPWRLNSASVSDEQLSQGSSAVIKPVERLFPRTAHHNDDIPGSYNLDLRSCDTAIQARNPCAGHPIDQPFLYKDIATWNNEDVCAWLATLEEKDESEINQFRKAKIRGNALMKMTEEKMEKHFPELAIGDIWHILEERDNFQPQSVPRMPLGRVEDLPCSEDPTVHVHDLYPSATLATNTTHPVQCTSHRLNLDMFTSRKSDAEARQNEATCAPPLGQTTTVPVRHAGEIELHPTIIQQDSVLTECAQPASEETPNKEAVSVLQEDEKSEPTLGVTQDSFITPLKGATESDPLESPLKRSIEKDPRETPLKRPIEKDPRETPLKRPIDTDPRETSLKQPIENDPRETPLKRPIEKDPRETPLKRPIEKDPRETPLKRPIEKIPRETPLKQPIENDPLEDSMKPQINNNPSETPLKTIVHDIECQDLHVEEANTNNPPLKTDKTPGIRDPNDISEKRKSVSKAPDPSALNVNTSDLDRETPLKCMHPFPSDQQDSTKLNDCTKFNTAVALKTYGLGNKLHDNEGLQDGHIKMIRKFVDQGSIKTNKEKVLFMVETMTFLSACLNERYNGTIHFGVTSKDQSREGQRKSGIIKGVHFDHARREEFEEMLRKSLQKCFAEDQAHIVFHCLRPVQYIPVVDLKKGEPTRDLFVIEVVVSPTAEMCAEESFFVKIPSYNRKKKKASYSEENKLFRCFDGEIRACGPEELQTYMQNKERITEEHKRKQTQEDLAKAQADEMQSDLYLKLCDLLCKGENSMPVDLYPILVVNKPPESMSEEDMKKSLSFLADVQFKVTFDFDDSGKLSEYVENIEEKPLKIIATADDFKETSDANMRKPDRLKNLQDDIKNSRDQFWIFTNGHRKDRKTTYEWKRQNKEGFKEAVRFYHREIPEGRALVVFLLLSDDQDVMLAAAEDLITSFTDQWMAISESEHLADNWAKELVRRNCIDEKTWKKNSIIGMPLSHISESVKRMQGPVRHEHPMLPTPTGAYIPLREALADLDVLSAEECENYQPSPPPRSRFELQKEAEFYKGGPVDWWNFWYQHVLARSKLHDLKKLISSALKAGKDEEDQYVGRIQLYHQNGAGGTTLAMNALWEYRKTHRCALVNNISDAAQTAEQILHLRAYGDHHPPHPVLVLLDNLDEEKSNNLQTILEEQAKQIARMDSGKLKVFCVLINCIRRNQLPKDRKDKRILLRHELDTQEQNWFKQKYHQLNKNHQDHLIGDPKLLISFNIMKENFGQEYMKRTVAGLLADVTDQTEKKLLKFVALLNAFDIQNQAIPTSAFDMMMSKNVWQGGLRYGRGAYQRRWECNLSAAIRVLLNATSQVSMGYISAIQIASPLLSKHILDAMQANDSVKQTISDMAMELFSTSNIFNYRSVACENLLKIVKDVLKSRQRSENGLPETTFAPIIQAIVDKETTDKAGEVMENGFQITNDPFVAQQLARLYIYAKNWERAKHFAKAATDMKGDNSFLWDTYGRVYLGELTEHYKTIFTTDKYLKPAECSVLVESAFKGIEVFKCVQELSLEEKRSMTSNNAGYFGELEMVNSLLDCLSYVTVFDTREHMKHFLMDRTYVVPEMCELDDKVHDACFKLKTLFENSNNAITHLEDESIQLRGNNIDDSKKNLHHKQKQKLNTLKGNLDPYFGEDSDEAPATLTEEEKCQYHRRRLFQMGANSMMRIFDLKSSTDGEQELKRMKRIVMHNINTRYETADDLQVIMCVNLALVQVHIDYTSSIVFEDMVNMSQRLYEKRGTRNFIYLEPFLFYVMFNWPQTKRVYHAPAHPKTRQSARPETKPINHRMLTDALRKWREAYYEKYPKQRDEWKFYRKKDTTIFFFSNGSGINSIVSQGSLSFKGEEVKGERFWNQPKVQRELKRFQGVLCSDGDEVELTIEYPSGNKDTLNIPTSFPIRDRKMLNKRVYFVIGFSWKGPKAFHISTSDPTEDPKHMASNHTHDQDTIVRARHLRPAVSGQNQDGLEPHAIYLRKVSQCTKKLNEIAKLKSTLEAGEHLNQSQVQLLGEEHNYKKRRDHLIDERARAMDRNWESLNDF